MGYSVLYTRDVHKKQRHRKRWVEGTLTRAEVRLRVCICARKLKICA